MRYLLPLCVLIGAAAGLALLLLWPWATPDPEPDDGWRDLEAVDCV